MENIFVRIINIIIFLFFNIIFLADAQDPWRHSQNQLSQKLINQHKYYALINNDIIKNAIPEEIKNINKMSPHANFVFSLNKIEPILDTLNRIVKTAQSSLGNSPELEKKISIIKDIIIIIDKIRQEGRIDEEKNPDKKDIIDKLIQLSDKCDPVLQPTIYIIETIDKWLEDGKKNSGENNIDKLLRLPNLLEPTLLQSLETLKKIHTIINTIQNPAVENSSLNRILNIIENINQKNIKKLFLKLTIGLPIIGFCSKKIIKNINKISKKNYYKKKKSILLKSILSHLTCIIGLSSLIIID